MVQSLKERGYIESPPVEKAFRKVPREEFVPLKVEHEAYADRPLPIGQGQTISASSMVAIMLEVLQAKSGQKVLEIGTGSKIPRTSIRGRSDCRWERSTTRFGERRRKPGTWSEEVGLAKFAKEYFEYLWVDTEE